MNAISQDKILISSTNSTNNTLVANEVFAGKPQNVEGCVELIINYTSDVSSATDGISIEFGPDGISWPKTSITTSPINIVSGEYGENKSLWVIDKYFRIVYTNGDTDQSNFQLQSAFKVFRDPSLLSTSMSNIYSTQSAQIVRQASDYKRDVAMGLIKYSSNFIVNGMRESGIGDSEVVLTTIPTNDYQWPQVARKLRIKAGGNVNDTVAGSGANYVTIVGLDENWNQYYETIATAGTSASSWTTGTFFRVNVVIVSAVGTYSGSNEGAIKIESETDLSELGNICPGHSKSLMSNFTVPKGYSCVIPRVAFMCDNDHSVTITGWFRKNAEDLIAPYNAKCIINYIPGLTGAWESKPEELIKFEEQTDFWITAKKVSGTDNAQVTVAYDVDLLKNSS